MIVVIDYGVGNLASVVNMIKKAGGEACASAAPEVLEAADKLVLPGVGAFDYGMGQLNSSGLGSVLKARVSRGVPTMGICLGMQLLSRSSEEGSLPGLGLIPAAFTRFQLPETSKLRVPHVGWNTVDIVKNNPLLSETGDKRFYFVHSYFAQCDEIDDVLAVSTHGQEFPVAYSRGNLYGFQFHPEKSHRFGLELFKNFLDL